MLRISRGRLSRFAHHLRQLHRPLVQDADLAVCLLCAFHDNGDLGADLDPSELRADWRRFRDALLEFGGLEEFKEDGSVLGYRVGVGDLPPSDEAMCSLDPFSYVSHLSAMAWHGLTVRVPKTLFMTRPSPKLWRSLSLAKLGAQLGELMPVYQRARLPGYRALGLRRIRKRPVHLWHSSRLDTAYQAAYKHVQGGHLRVATVARCFLDMVRAPDLCGGIYHVIEVYHEHGHAHLEQILSELDRHGNKLEQARAGYLLEEAAPELQTQPVLERWAHAVTRGGSRKLDPSGDYASTFSERWALSINV